MPATEAPCVELGNVPEPPSIVASPSASDISSTSSPEPQHVHATPLFRALAMPPPDPAQPPGQEELERRIPGYRRIVIPRELTLIELLKESSGAITDEEVLRIREARLKVVAERVGLRRLHILAPRLKSLTLDGSALSSLRDLGIGLVHLKILSVKRCGLTSLDGVWGLGALKELYAAGNRLQNLQALAALQKLNTLDLSENLVSESSPLWTLGVCSSLRRLTLRGCPVSNIIHYRTKVSSALPLLIYLDDRLINAETPYDSGDEIFGTKLSSESEESEAEPEFPQKQFITAALDPVPGTSSETHIAQEEDCVNYKVTDEVIPDATDSKELERRRRPATTEGVGARPRHDMPRRPLTAHARGSLSDAGDSSRLEILNTLLDDEWRCSGSNLTSRAAVCGNLARALRRPATAAQRRCDRLEEEASTACEETVQSAARALAAEIPILPSAEDWEKFRRETGIEIDLDFNERPKSANPAVVMARLEQIEKETSERFKQSSNGSNIDDTSRFTATPNFEPSNIYIFNTVNFAVPPMNDILELGFDAWRDIESLAPNPDERNSIDVGLGLNIDPDNRDDNSLSRLSFDQIRHNNSPSQL